MVGNRWSRRRWLVLASGLAGLSVVGDRGLAQGRTVSLETQLKKGLRVTRRSQETFIDLVLLRVQQRALPEGLVNLVYKWARERYPRVPFPYFQFALRELARRRGVSL